MSRTGRDSRLIDALEALPARRLTETVWRVVREGRDPCNCNASGGRWDDETFDVLYTSRERDGAIAEMFFGSFEFCVGYAALGLILVKSSFPAMRKRTVRMVVNRV
jgi:hypothetical protein